MLSIFLSEGYQKLWKKFLKYYYKVKGIYCSNTFNIGKIVQSMQMILYWYYICIHGTWRKNKKLPYKSSTYYQS